MAEEYKFYFERDDDGRLLAVLPSGGRPVITPMLPARIRRVYAAFQQPEVPKKVVEVEGTGLGQPFDDPGDPEYQEKLAEWFFRVQNAIFDLAVIDSLVVPEDDEWAWKLKEVGIPIPQNGLERKRCYVEEVFPELLADFSADRRAFVNAIVQISVPTGPGIDDARRRFPDEVEGNATDEAEADAETGVSPGEHGASGTDGG